MITRWVIVDTNTGQVESDAYATEQAAWKAQVELGTAQNRSPYEWTAWAINVDIQ